MKTGNIWTASERTAGSVAVVSEVTFVEALRNARLLPHLLDLRNAELGIGPKEQLPVPDGEVVLLPVPQVLQLLVVERREGVHATGVKEEGVIIIQSHFTSIFRFLKPFQTTILYRVSPARK